MEREVAGPDLPLDPGVAKRWILLLKWPDLETFYRFDENKLRQARHEQQQQRIAVFAKIIFGVLLFLAIGASCTHVSGKSRAPCRRKAIAC